MQRFENILCVINSNDACDAALERATSLAETNQASLRVADISEPFADIVDAQWADYVAPDVLKEARKHHLETLLAPYRKRIPIASKALTGTAFLEIIREVLRNEHDLVIKTPEKQDWLDRVFGSDDMHLLRKCPCPVWLIRPQTSKTFSCILAAVDVDDIFPARELESRHGLNTLILQLASSLAISDAAELHVVHAWEAIGEPTLRSVLANTPEDKISAYVKQVRVHRGDKVSELLQDLRAALEPEVRKQFKAKTHLVKGRARKEIPLLAQSIKADLVVMGTVARTGISGFLMGNTAETILNRIECSVLAVKPPGFLTPVTLQNQEGNHPTESY